MKRFLIALLVGGVLFTAAFAAAASLTIAPTTLQVGQADVLACDPDGVFVDGWGYENDTLSVSYVRIGGIHDDCAGSDMHVDVYDNGNHIGDGGSWVINANTSPNFVFAGGPVPAADIESIHIGIEP